VAMQLTPRYDGRPALSVEVPVPDPSVPLLRQRRRLAHTMGTLATEKWGTASRCSGWSVQDVIAHLIGTNRFWALSIRSGLAGAPTRYLAAFDPVATPQLMVEQMRALSPAAVLNDFAESNEDLAAALEGIDADSWSHLAEAPPGYVALRTLALHALWDAWVHERDIVIPLALNPVEEVDEVTDCLLYVAILGPAFFVTSGAAQAGTLAIHSENPEVHFVVDVTTTVVARKPVQDDVGAPRLCGTAVELIEGLSLRIPLRHHLTAGDRWLVSGLADAFKQSA
jgi:uncharacterized protein (TIGR03083 family)